MTWIVIFIIASVIFGLIGFGKMHSREAYVGGDAYNFIINANHATAYFVLSMFLGLTAVGLGIIKAIYLTSTMKYGNHTNIKE